MQLFFIDDIESNYCQLDEEESKHCIRVLRMGYGDEIHVTDGHGTLCRCRIVEPHAKSCGLEVVERIPDYGRRTFRLHLAVAATKNTARMEWLLEKAVEMGIDEFVPLLCDHSERTTLRHDRMERIVVSAMKQSLKTYRPAVRDITPMRQLLAEPFDGSRFIAYCDGDHRTPLKQAYNPGSDALILIGPEGDFSDEEVQAALAAGFEPVTLGPCRLRTETAALAACAFFNLVSE